MKSEYEYLDQILKSLVLKYSALGYQEWLDAFNAGSQFHDYCEDIDAPNPDKSKYWQAHTDVLELSEENEDEHLQVCVTIYPYGVHTSPPAPSATLLIYKSGLCKTIYE